MQQNVVNGTGVLIVHQVAAVVGNGVLARAWQAQRKYTLEFEEQGAVAQALLSLSAVKSAVLAGTGRGPRPPDKCGVLLVGERWATGLFDSGSLWSKQHRHAR